MRIQDKVCTYEQAQELYNMGVRRLNHDEGFYYHSNRIDKITLYYEESFASQIHCMAAFDGAELGIMLPPHFATLMHDGHKHCHCRNERTDTFPLIDSGQEYEQTPAYVLNKELIPIQTGRTEAEAKTAMLIYLLKKEYITVADVNQRLADA